MVGGVGYFDTEQSSSSILDTKSINNAGQGTIMVMVDNGMDIDIITPEEAVESLIQLIQWDSENKSIFSAQDSMETINLEESILNLNIQGLDGVPNLLYSEEIYYAEKDIGIEMPIDKLVKISNKTIVLIGVSGCGKTRTCYDLCRKF